MTKCAIYARISTHDQHIESQLYQLRELAARRGFEVVQEYTCGGNLIMSRFSGENG
jgi:DNA invertase Pin-like site-specific DNA recombinase